MNVLNSLTCTSGVFVDSLGFSLYIIILFCEEESLIFFSLPTVACLHYFLPYCTCESFQSNVEQKWRLGDFPLSLILLGGTIQPLFIKCSVS